MLNNSSFKYNSLLSRNLQQGPCDLPHTPCPPECIATPDRSYACAPASGPHVVPGKCSSQMQCPEGSFCDFPQMYCEDGATKCDPDKSHCIPQTTPRGCNPRKDLGCNSQPLSEIGTCGMPKGCGVCTNLPGEADLFPGKCSVPLPSLGPSYNSNDCSTASNKSICCESSRQYPICPKGCHAADGGMCKEGPSSNVGCEDNKPCSWNMECTSGCECVGGVCVTPPTHQPSPHQHSPQPHTHQPSPQPHTHQPSPPPHTHQPSPQPFPHGFKRNTHGSHSICQGRIPDLSDVCAYYKSNVPKKSQKQFCEYLRNPSVEPAFKKDLQYLSCSPTQENTIYSGLEKCMGCTPSPVKKGLSDGAIVGIVIGSLALVIIVIMLLKRKKK